MRKSTINIFTGRTTAPTEGEISMSIDHEGQVLKQSGHKKCVLLDAVHLGDLISDLGKTTVELSKNLAMNRVCETLI